jgi:hypothetical protein
MMYLINSPQAYLTTVGLYNDNNDLLGVAKVIKTVIKRFYKRSISKNQA